MKIKEKKIFIYINKKNKDFYKEELKQLEERYKIECKVSFFSSYDLQESHCLICMHEPLGVIGGAKLSLPKHATALQFYLQESSTHFNDAWVIEKVFFHIPSTSEINASIHEFRKICQSFYQGLYQSLMTIAKKELKKVLLVFNALDEHEDTKFFGKWPFVMQHIIHPIGLSNEMVLGILDVPQDEDFKLNS